MLLEGSIDIDRPIETVFDFVADPRNDSRWCPRVISCEQRPGESPGRGARYDVLHDPTLIRRHTRSIEIVEFDRPRRMVSRQEDEVAAFTISYLLERTPRGTRLTQRDEIAWRISRIARPVAKRIVGRHIGSQLRKLKQVLESPDPAAA